jgi:hypothetical protein
LRRAEIELVHPPALLPEMGLAVSDESIERCELFPFRRLHQRIEAVDEFPVRLVDHRIADRQRC